jgi:hypothetical protein
MRNHRYQSVGASYCVGMPVVDDKKIFRHLDKPEGKYYNIL